MIPKMTSHELNNILNNANAKLDGVITDVKHIKNDISKKLKILRYESEYIETQMSEIKLMHNESSKSESQGSDMRIFATPDKKLSNAYEQYGCAITPKFKSMPVNVFNILATATGEAFYRDIAEVAVNNVVRDEYKSILKHDSLSDKELFFEEIDGENPSMDISITLDKTKTLGNSLFNMIEIDTFLNGSYLIEHIRIYTEEVTDNEAESKYEELTDIKNAGKMRLVLNKEYEFSRVDIRIKPMFNTQVNGVKKSPIGIKHIYFYNTKFISDSFVIVPIESRDFMDKIDNEYSIIRPNETVTASADEEGVEFYLDCKINPVTGEPILSTLQEPSKPGNTKIISINVKKIYAKIPLSIIHSTDKDDSINNQSITGFVFNTSSKII